MIDLQALIRASKAALEELQNGTYEIITRSTPATWEDLREDLETKLIPILYELFNEIGGLKVIPTVTLPDGVTSTSLVSQSEMTQYVTNTLNVWMAALMGQVKAVKKNTFFSILPQITLTIKRPKKYDLFITPSEIPAIPLPSITIEKGD